MTVVQAGSMGKAAQRLNTTQPNISRSIAELEYALGVRLLDRHRQGSSRPSTVARYSIAERPYSMTCARELRRSSFSPTLELGKCGSEAATFVAEHFVSAVIKRLSRRYPRIVFHLVTADETDTLHRELSERNVDLLIARRAGLFTDEQLGLRNSL